MDIQDFGEKIGGAKKDLWKERGLLIEDLLYMNDAEKNKLVTKDNIWKKPNYQEMVNKGIPTRAVYFVKMIRDATPTRPIIYSFDKNSEKIKEKQEGYIEFVTKLRDYAMNISTENEILEFYNDFMSNYVTFTNRYSVNISHTAFDCINNKLLHLIQLKDFKEIDREIEKKQFCYTDDEKVLANFDIFVYDKENVEFQQESDGRTVIKLISGYSIYFLYPKGELSNQDNWKDNTVFIIYNRDIIKNNIENIDVAEKFILENYKEKFINKENNVQHNKKRFIPKQLKNIIRNGEDYRKNNNVTGQNMIQKFNFKGGEFGNWLSENDRQQSLNHGYDAFLDLCKALSISPTDISLAGKLSIAFGSRGRGNALAHYESDREVINLTKANGAGSLAHEWGHALDDIVGKQLGLNGFLTENYRYSDSSSEIIKDIIETMKYKVVSGPQIIEKQVKEYEKQINKITNLINSFFPKEHLTAEQVTKKDVLIQKIIDTAKESSKNLAFYLRRGDGNKEIDELSSLRKQAMGRNISQNDRIQIIYAQNNVANKKEQIGKSEKISTDFYKNSIMFDNTYCKAGHGYWQSTIEMFARSFACYVHDRLGNRNDYLCGHANLAIGTFENNNGEIEVIKAFPEGNERKLINEKIDKLIDFLKEKNILHDYNLQKEHDNYDYDY